MWTSVINSNSIFYTHIGRYTSEQRNLIVPWSDSASEFQSIFCQPSQFNLWYYRYQINVP